jgi:hypothetical protein
MAGPDQMKATLRTLRDRLALEVPRARARPDTPPDLVERLQAALDYVSGIFLLPSSSTSSAAKALDEAREDALVEGHLALHEWERLLESASQQKRRSQTPTPLDRRQHARQGVDVTVKLLRHQVRGGGFGENTLESEATSRQARNVSIGGIFVALSGAELPKIGVGAVVHVAVTVGGAPSFEARTVVMRRDGAGLGLQWIVDSDRTRRAIESLMEAISRGSRAAGGS